jgi:hypothetical protein
LGQWGREVQKKGENKQLFEGNTENTGVAMAFQVLPSKLS